MCGISAALLWILLPSQCRQEASESFDDFHIRLKGPAEAADLTVDSEKWMTVRILASSRDAEAKQKLFAMRDFPTLQQAVDVCRSEESARQNVRELDGQAAVSRVPDQKRRDKVAATNKGPKCPTCKRKPQARRRPAPRRTKRAMRAMQPVTFLSVA